MNEFISAFKQRMESDGLKPNSVIKYTAEIRQLFTACNITKPSEITTDAVEKYFAEQNKKVGKSKTHGGIYALQKVVEYYDLKDIRLPKKPTVKTVEPRIPLREDELKTLIEGIGLEYCNNPRQIRALVAFFYYTGLREGEVAKLRRASVQGKDELVITQEKTGSVRPIIINKNLKCLLDDYFATENEVTNLFNLSARSMRRWVKRVFTDILRKKGFPHLLRHSFVSHCHRNGVDLKSIQVAVGHASIRQTEKYLEADARLMAEEIKLKVKGVAFSDVV